MRLPGNNGAAATGNPARRKATWAARAESRPALRYFPCLFPIRYRIVYLILLRLDYPRRAGTPGSGAIAPSDGLQDWSVHKYVNDLPGTGRAANRVRYLSGWG